MSPTSKKTAGARTRDRDRDPDRDRVKYKNFVKHLTLSLMAPRYIRIIDENNTPSERLSRFLHEIALHAASAIPRFEHALLNAINSVDPEKQWTKNDLDLDDPYIFATFADAAVSLPHDKPYDPILEAFKAANLDPKHPLSWRILLYALCILTFPPKEKDGRPPFWTSDRYCKLLIEIYRHKPKHRRTRWENPACDALAKRELPEFVKHSKPLSAAALKRALRQARDPKYNWSLCRMVAEGFDRLRADYERRGQEWPPVEPEAALARLKSLDDGITPTPSAESASETVGPQGKGNSKPLNDKSREYKEALLRAATEEDGDVDAFIRKHLEQQQNVEEAVRAALSDHYCEQIAKRGVAVSSDSG